MTNDSKTPLGAKPSNSPQNEDGDNSQGGLLSRWSARKRAVAQNETAMAEAQIEADRQKEQQPDIEARQAANREIAEAIDIDVADYDTDFTPFLKDGVPAALRRRALKAMWRTNPILANVDGLNDYDEDFRTVQAGFEVVKSTWEVGRGYAGKAKEVAREMEARDEEVVKAVVAEREAAEKEAADKSAENSKIENADVAQDDNGNEKAGGTNDVMANTEDQITEDDGVEDEPAQAALVSPRASLRQRLLQNQG